MQRDKLIPALLLLAISLGFLFTSVRASMVADEGDATLAALPAAKVSPAPDWTLTDIHTGRAVNLRAQTRLRPVVFSFWATWCEPCKQELPHVQRVFSRYKGRVDFYGVNSNDPPQAMADFASRRSLAFPMLSDNQQEAATRYGVEAIPLLVVVDTQGNIRAVTSGYNPDENLEGALSHLLDTLLAKPPRSS